MRRSTARTIAGGGAEGYYVYFGVPTNIAAGARDTM